MTKALTRNMAKVLLMASDDQQVAFFLALNPGVARTVSITREGVPSVNRTWFDVLSPTDQASVVRHEILHFLGGNGWLPQDGDLDCTSGGAPRLVPTLWVHVYLQFLTPAEFANAAVDADRERQSMWSSALDGTVNFPA